MKYPPLLLVELIRRHRYRSIDFLGNLSRYSDADSPRQCTPGICQRHRVHPRSIPYHSTRIGRFQESLIPHPFIEAVFSITVTLSAANLQDFVADASVSIYKGTLGFAQNLVVSPEQWGAIMGLVDGSNRPLFTAIAPQNAPGTLAPGAVRGNVSGLALYVDRSLTTGSGLGDGTMLVINPESYTWYESSRFRLETNVIASGQVSVAYYGYGAIATKVAAGAYKWMVA